MANANKGKKIATQAKIKSKTQKEEVLAAVAKLDRRGHTQKEIADTLREMGVVDVSCAMISHYLKEIRTKYAEMLLAERKELVSEKIEQYREVRREAWAAWERSKQDTKKVVREKGPPVKLKFGEKGKPPNHNKDKGDFEESMRLLKQVVTKEGRLPASEYLVVVMKTLEAEARLQGLLEPQQEEPPGDNGKTPVQESWEDLFWRLANPQSKRVTVEATPVPLPAAPPV